MKFSFLILFLFSSLIAFSQEKIEVDKSSSKKNVPLYHTEKAPTYMGCIGDNRSKMKCLTTKINQHVAYHFNGSKAGCLKFITRYDRKLKRNVEVCKEKIKDRIVRIKTTFVIDTTGFIINVRAISPYPSLNSEAIRVLETIPRIEPGEQRGKKVRVMMSLPILFKQ